ncbi:hypothetical protein [Paraburkholderia lacunae]|uniref:hypothetical protein n=1 Tax=Paraburkholderia lacunae TaxID=2211104 RepID=UPI0014031E27|nr:hypothetical protein [Paraburkholderia lacunae]
MAKRDASANMQALRLSMSRVASGDFLTNAALIRVQTISASVGFVTLPKLSRKIA